MVIRVNVVGMLQTPNGKKDFEVEVPEGKTVLDLLETIGFQPRHIPHILTTVNGRLRHREHVLAVGDAVELSILLGGG
ncbi:MAG: MoaD/ThiS family protein [Acidobacteria bacterium]|nr:MoaD/ThiS family protein [Acidobacteriota bacterium]